MIQVIVFLHIREGQIDTFLDGFRAVAPQVRAEVGCIEYGLTQDVDTRVERFTPPRDNVFTLFERWESLDALHAHLATNHMNAYRKAVDGAIERVEIFANEPV